MLSPPPPPLRNFLSFIFTAHIWDGTSHLHFVFDSSYSFDKFDTGLYFTLEIFHIINIFIMDCPESNIQDLYKIVSRLGMNESQCRCKGGGKVCPPAPGPSKFLKNRLFIDNFWIFFLKDIFFLVSVCWWVRHSLDACVLWNKTLVLVLHSGQSDWLC